MADNVIMIIIKSEINYDWF